MGQKRLINIGTLYGITNNNNVKKGQDLSRIGTINNAYLDFKDGLIIDYGEMANMPKSNSDIDDIRGGIVYPCYVDCHTHLVYAANREGEFVDRINGLSYQEIASKGGGILNSAAKLQAMSEDELFNDALVRVHKLVRLGTGAIEIKSGYGLTVEAELKMLRVIKRLKAENLIPIKATFLGAHAFPKEYSNNHEGYIDLIINEMLPRIQDEQLADYIDAFCEDGYFSVEQTERIVKAGLQIGLKSRLHVNQFTSSGAVEMAVKNEAISVEHLEVMTTEDLNILSDNNLFAVALPACSFFLKIPYTPARDLIEKNVPFVLASDYNPGSSPTGNLSFVMSLACIYLNLLPEEALNALTINASAALQIEDEVGSIAINKKANVVVSKQVKSLNAVPYLFGENTIDSVYVNGELFL